MLRCRCPVSSKHLLVTDSETESDDGVVGTVKRKRNRKGSTIHRKNPMSKKNEKGKEKLSSAPQTNQVRAKPFKSQPKDDLVELAKKYQKHMKKIPIPRARLRYNVVVNWQDLAKTLKSLYGQSLHYLTFMLCKQWDQSRLGSEDEGKPLDTIINWSNAENAIWNVEEIHRLCTSPIHLAKLWLSDPEYRSFVDEVLPSP